MTAKQPLLVIENLHVSVEDKEILHGVNLTINPGEIHAIMGRNGSGKSTLSYTLMGHPRYHITKAWYVAAQIQNLFDKDYELAYTYNTPRRGAYITLGWQQQ